MADRTIAGRTLKQWIREHPLLEDMLAGKEVFWANPLYEPLGTAGIPLDGALIRDAAERLRRFSPYIARAFPETAKSGGSSSRRWWKNPPCGGDWPSGRGAISRAGCC